jgi:hypothetical protein
MKKMKTIYVLTLLIFTLTACGQTKGDRTILGKSYAEKELKSALTDKSQHNVVDNTTAIIKDSLTAINVAEPILFGIYGKDNIVKQRPYEIYLFTVISYNRNNALKRSVNLFTPKAPYLAAHAEPHCSNSVDDCIQH